MAVVIPKTPKASLVPLTVSTSNLHLASQCQTPCWTATERTGSRIAQEMNKIGGVQTGPARDFLANAQSKVEHFPRRIQNTIGIKAPKPVGIVTFEDIIDLIFQKTSRDEKDFFDRNNATPSTKSRKAGDYQINLPPGNVQESVNAPIFGNISFQRPGYGTVRRRKLSHKQKIATGLDGVDDRSSENTEGQSLNLRKTRAEHRENSCTQNNQGGFHGVHQSSRAPRQALVISSEELSGFAQKSSLSLASQDNPDLPNKTASLPSRSGSLTPTNHAGLSPPWRRASALPVLPRVRRVTPFSRQESSSCGNEVNGTMKNFELIMPLASMLAVNNLSNNLPQQINTQPSGADITDSDNITARESTYIRDVSGEMISLSSWYPGDDGLGPRVSCPSSTSLMGLPSRSQINSHGEATSGPEPYDGFPPELLDSGKDNSNLAYASKTLPRMIGLTADLDAERERREVVAREQSFHDDRALLPSQRRIMEGSGSFGVTRSSSLWF